MNPLIPCVTLLAVTTALAAVSRPALGESPPSADHEDVRVVLTIRQADAHGEPVTRTLELSTRLQGRETRVASGETISLPSTSFDTSARGGRVVPVTSYVRHHVGLSARVATSPGGGGRVRLVGAVGHEQAIDAARKDGTSPPTLASFDHRSFEFQAASGIS